MPRRSWSPPCRPSWCSRTANPEGLPIEVFDGLRTGLVKDRSQFYKDLATPFYGANRPGAQVSQGVLDQFWLWSMQSGLKNAYLSIKAFSETDFTEDLKSFDVPDPGAARRGRPDRPGQGLGAQIGPAHQGRAGDLLPGRAARPDGHPPGPPQRRPARVPAKLGKGDCGTTPGSPPAAATARRHCPGRPARAAGHPGFADCIGSVFGPGRADGIPGHPGIETALVTLYRATGQRRYLELAGYFVDQRGHGMLAGAEFGPRYRQDDVPFRRSWSARGHAVMAGYLASGALDVFLKTGDERLLDTAVAQWEDMVSFRIYVTGGRFAAQRRIIRRPVRVAPGPGLLRDLRRRATVMWGWRRLVATGEPRYADVIERVLFNTFTAGVSLDGKSYFYVNPLQVRARRQDPEDGRGAAARAPWYPIACCPPNVMRTLSSLGQYFATTTDDGVQLWQFAPSRVAVTVAGHPFELTVSTDYPLSGRISVRVEQAGPESVELGLRVPGWAQPAHGMVRPAGHDNVLAGDRQPGAVWRIRRHWQPGDELVLELPLPVRLTTADPRIDAVRGCVAVERGPLVYCLEEADAGGPAELEAVILPADAAFTAVHAEISGEPVIKLAVPARQRPLPTPAVVTRPRWQQRARPPAVRSASSWSPTPPGATGTPARPCAWLPAT